MSGDSIPFDVLDSEPFQRNAARLAADLAAEATELARRIDGSPRDAAYALCIVVNELLDRIEALVLDLVRSHSN